MVSQCKSVSERLRQLVADKKFLSVPLDYLNPDAGVAKIALGRFNATGNRKGSLFVNPGGPGGPGVGLATQAGTHIQSIVRTSYIYQRSRQTYSVMT